MNVPVQTKPTDTRERIIETAEQLFRRMGFAKTAVADIAAELGMSPANVYRFFSSKHAIVEAICQRALNEVEERGWAIARSRGSAAGRMERLFLDILAYHKANFLAEQRVHDMVLAAIENNWDTIQAHKEVMRTIGELIIRDGIESGEFEAVEPRETARLFMRSMIAYMHPILVAQCLNDEEDVDASARAAVRFLLRAITPRS